MAKRPEQRFPDGAGFMNGLLSVARKYRLAVPTQQQLAALVPPHASSAGESTISLGRGKTPTGLRAPVMGPPSPPVAPKPNASEPTKIGQIAPRPAEQAPTLPSRARPVYPAPLSPLDDDRVVLSLLRVDARDDLGVRGARVGRLLGLGSG